MPVIIIIRNSFPEINFDTFEVEHDPSLCSDIDYLGWVGEKAFGIQIKPVTAKANFGNYSATERMKNSFANFTEKFGGNVFVVFSVDDKISNAVVINEIADEIKRLGN